MNSLLQLLKNEAEVEFIKCLPLAILRSCVFKNLGYELPNQINTLIRLIKTNQMNEDLELDFIRGLIFIAVNY